MVGDAGFGVNISSGFEKVLQKFSTLRNPDIGMILRTAGQVFTFDIGSTIGGFIGRAFQAAGIRMQEKTQLTAQDLVQILQTMLATIEEIGGAKVGDKTLIDALEPAVGAAKSALDSGITSTPDILARAASTAENGAKHTEGVIAKMGRGSYLGERSRGSIDPGAMFISIFLQALRKPE